jgi:uncharacterized protein DUF1360
MELAIWVFFLFAGAAARLTQLICNDKITAPIRAAALKRSTLYTSQSGYTGPPATERGAYAFLTCPWCVGFWMAVLLFAVASAVTAWPDGAFAWLLWAAQVLFASFLIGYFVPSTSARR